MPRQTSRDLRNESRFEVLHALSVLFEMERDRSRLPRWQFRRQILEDDERGVAEP